jgi:hypothetical protein
MAHVRKQIRDALATAVTGLSTTGANVYTSRVYPISSASLPALLVYTKDESSEYETITKPRTILRTLSAVIDIYVKGNTTYDDTIDTIAAEVETALTDVTLSGLAKDLMITGFTTEFSGDPDQPVGTATLSIDIEYVTIEQSPEVAA